MNAKGGADVTDAFKLKYDCRMVGLSDAPPSDALVIMKLS